jgi:hypothetical protein
MGNFDKALDEDYQNQPVMSAIPPVKPTVIWDIGPQLPSDVPQRPGHSATPEDWMDHEENTARFVAKIFQWRRLRAEWVQKHGGGPVRLDLDPASAREAIERGGGQYVSTLPSGLMPGVRSGAGS